MAVTHVRPYRMPPRDVPTYTRRIENTPTRVTRYHVGSYNVPGHLRTYTAGAAPAPRATVHQRPSEGVRFSANPKPLQHHLMKKAMRAQGNKPYFKKNTTYTVKPARTVVRQIKHRVHHN